MATTAEEKYKKVIDEIPQIISKSETDIAKTQETIKTLQDRADAAKQAASVNIDPDDTSSLKEYRESVDKIDIYNNKLTTLQTAPLIDNAEYETKKQIIKDYRQKRIKEYNKRAAALLNELNELAHNELKAEDEANAMLYDLQVKIWRDPKVTKVIKNGFVPRGLTEQIEADSIRSGIFAATCAAANVIYKATGDAQSND